MRILMINKFLFPRGGAETYMFKLGEYLEEKGNEVEYFGMYDKNNIVFNSANQYTQNLDFHNGSFIKKLFYPFKIVYSKEARKKLRKVLDKFNPEVIHVNNFNYQLTPSILVEIKKWKKDTGSTCRVIETAHDSQMVCPSHTLRNISKGENCEKCLGGHYNNCIKGKCIHGSFLRSVIGTVESNYWNKRKKIYGEFDCIISCSNFMKSKLDTNPVLKDKTVTVTNFIPEKEKKQVVKEDYVLYFGRYSAEKGMETVFETAEKLPNIKFVFAGRGDLKDKIPKLDNVVDVGFKSGEELDDLIRKARVSVCPSVCYENCPFSVLESQCLGTPVIGANIGGIPELIEVGKTGELFESGNSESLKEKIEYLFNNKDVLEKYTQNCLNAEYITLDKYYDILMNIYKGEKL